jgi:glycosyltransferase involved in cell wall biosynthesis
LLDLIFVDDGSSDGTAELLGLSAAQVGASVLRLARNAGKAEAVRRGLLQALGSGADVVGFLDADGAFPASEPQRLLEILSDDFGAGELDAVWSSRVALAGRDVTRTLSRHYMGRVMATYVLRGQDGAPYDSQSGLKWFVASKTFVSVLADPFVTRWLFEIEMLARHRTLTGRPLKIWEEPCSKWDEIAGSRVTSKETLRIIRESRIARRALSRAFTGR